MPDTDAVRIPPPSAGCGWRWMCPCPVRSTTAAMRRWSGAARDRAVRTSQDDRRGGGQSGRAVFRPQADQADRRGTARPAALRRRLAAPGALRRRVLPAAAGRGHAADPAAAVTQAVRLSGQALRRRAGGAAGRSQAQEGARAGSGRPAAGAERCAAGGGGNAGRPEWLQARVAVRRDRQQQDRGLPARRRARAGRRSSGAADGPGNQSDAATRRRAAGAAGGAAGAGRPGRDAQQPVRRRAAGCVVARPARPGAHAAGHAHGDIRAAVRAGPDHRR